MALIKCPECKKKISDQCNNCPQCGYPIKNNLQNITTEENDEGKIVFESKPFYKKIWVWIVVGLVLVGLVLSIVLLTRETKPRMDKDGNPVFVELTNEVYTNAKEYLGYHINIKGQVFQVMGNNGSKKGIQIWLDPETCVQNIMIYYSSDVAVEQGDYIICSGYIRSLQKYKNAYGAELQAPLVYSADLREASYIEAMAPTKDEYVLDNLVYGQYGYAISVDKVEFAEKETRIYVSVTNGGRSSLYVEDAVIIQDGNQYNSVNNFEANYKKIPNEIAKGASCSGIIVFPAINTGTFELTLNIHSGNYDEVFEEFIFTIIGERGYLLDYGYRTAVQTMVDFYNGELEEVNKVLPPALWNFICEGVLFTQVEAEEEIEYWFVKQHKSKVKKFKITSEERFSETQLEKYLDGIIYRYGELGIQSISDGYRLTVEVTRPNGKRVTERPVIIKIDNNWYWSEIDDTGCPYFHTGPFTPPPGSGGEFYVR